MLMLILDDENVSLGKFTRLHRVPLSLLTSNFLSTFFLISSVFQTVVQHSEVTPNRIPLRRLTAALNISNPIQCYVATFTGRSCHYGNSWRPVQYLSGKI